MKRHLFFKACIFFVLIPVLSSAQDFSWENGSKVANPVGSYGSPGVSSPSNEPFGRRYGASWSDTLGNLWLFGGDATLYSSMVVLNDLFKYNIATNIWTWMKGTNMTNDYGVYNIMGVPKNTSVPGARKSAATWTDRSGNLWLFGGYGYGASAGVYNYLNDLWKYNPVTDMWTWIKGSSVVFAPAVYGTKGVFDVANTPGARKGSVTAIDTSGKLWLYGGEGRDGNGSVYGLNDLWCYDIALNQWAWISGNKTNTSFGVYLTKGVPNPLSYPSGRIEGGAWADKLGNIWLFGGFGWTDIYDPGYKQLNDVWKYDIGTGLWTWMKGGDVSSEPSVYGTMGVPNPANTPGGRFGIAYGTDPAGNFWTFGGFEDNGVNSQELQNFWKYDPVSNQWTWMKGNQYPNSGVYGTMGVPAAGNLPGRRGNSTGWCDPAGNFWLFGGAGSGESTFGFLNDLWKFGNCVPGTFKINSSKEFLCEGESVTLSLNTNFPHSWSTNETSQSIVVSPVSSTTYSVTLNNVFGCNFDVAYTQSVSACDGIKEANAKGAEVVVYPNPTSGNFTVRIAGNGLARLQLFDVFGKVVIDKIIDPGHPEISCGFAHGIYCYEVSREGAISKGKLIIQ